MTTSQLPRNLEQGWNTVVIKNLAHFQTKFTLLKLYSSILFPAPPPPPMDFEIYFLCNTY